MSISRPLCFLLALAASASLPAAEASPGMPLGTAEAMGTRLAPFVQTSAAGDRFRPLPLPRFRQRAPRARIVFTLDPAEPRQTLEGIGGALTESSAFVLAQLPRPERARLLDRFFGPAGADFTLARTHIGACDFCVEGRYSYDDVPGDISLRHFSIAPDRRGFPLAKDPTYALLPLVKDALARRPDLRIVASPWTAPAWMKDNNGWYGSGKGGRLLPEHQDTFARYMVEYLRAYRAEGVTIWGVTPENEPLGNGGQWESMEFTAASMRDYVRDHLGPQLVQQGFAGVKLIQFDHNRDADAIRFTEAILGDPAAARFTWGTGVHWYNATNSSDSGLLDRLHQLSAGKPILHTEGCIDGIRTEESSPGGRFLGWRNDAWWWSRSATDWGYYWAAPEEKAAHPKYVPVHRYARDLVEGLNHWLAGWIDWNIVLDRNGGPNHVSNFCAAPIMVDTASGEVHVTPLYYVLAHFSRYLRPGDRIIKVTATSASAPGPDGLLVTAALGQAGRHLVVVAFNPSDEARTYDLQVRGTCATVSIPGNAIQTLRIPLNQAGSVAR